MYMLQVLQKASAMCKSLEGRNWNTTVNRNGEVSGHQAPGFWNISSWNKFLEWNKPNCQSCQMNVKPNEWNSKPKE